MAAPVTHAAAATLGDIAYVLGGRGPTTGTSTAAIIAVDIAHQRLHRAGRLAEPLSDLAAVGLGDRILVAGGRGRNGTVAAVSVIRSVVVKASTTSAAARAPALLDAANVYAADGANSFRGAARFAISRIYVPNSQSEHGRRDRSPTIRWSRISPSAYCRSTSSRPTT